ncbi:MAG: hypothetical protein ACXV3D_02540, partial [Halobacteriota archaeon]
IAKRRSEIRIAISMRSVILIFSFEDSSAMGRFGHGLKGFRGDILFDYVRAALLVAQVSATP